MFVNRGRNEAPGPPFHRFLALPAPSCQECERALARSSKEDSNLGLAWSHGRLLWEPVDFQVAFGDQSRPGGWCGGAGAWGAQPDAPSREPLDRAAFAGCQAVSLNVLLGLHAEGGVEGKQGTFLGGVGPHTQVAYMSCVSR